MFATLIEKLHRRQDLTVDEAAAVMEEIMAGRATPAQTAGFLIALSMKGERPSEIVGLATTMRANAVKLSKAREGLFDTCGTGGDGASTFNVSSLAALVLSACGVRVAKHGNRAVSSRCGSADLFSALGVVVDASPAVVERCLDDCGLAFLFAPTFHPSMRHAASARRELGVRTAFNLLGPLTNPAGVARQLVGVSRPEHTDLIARALVVLGAERAWVVHGADGLDEVSTTGYTKISECHDGLVRTFFLHPSDFGLAVADPATLRADSPDENEAIARAVLAGEPGPPRDMVLANAAASLFIMERVGGLDEGVSTAAAALDDGRAQKTLTRLVDLSGAGAGGHQ
ncbi:MAG: anthranilate phosphoribosyltransferase [Vicinamibacterales bacterium]|jgi:anthranilate phosphoribosyltransferase|nr:anthranilate phosphoribosyltransferase [Vicinamibacterales bacterium]